MLAAKFLGWSSLVRTRPFQVLKLQLRSRSLILPSLDELLSTIPRSFDSVDAMFPVTFFNNGSASPE